MKRTITVTGVGSVSRKPDCIRLSLFFESKDADYDRAILDASEKTERLQSALVNIGHAKDALKTLRFDVRVDYNQVQDEQGMYKQVFDGYVCSYRFRLSFDFDNQRLAETLGAIAASEAKPQLSIELTVKNPALVAEELLESAAKNARSKAEVLCRASGAVLGRLLLIDYRWSDEHFASRTRYALTDDAMPMMARGKAFMPEIEPDDISVGDTATFTWELEE